MQLRKLAICAITAAISVMITGLPASADSIYVGSDGVTVNCGYSQTCEGEGQSVPTVGIGGNSIDVACQAVTPFVVSATIASCYIQGTKGDVHWATDALTNGQVSNTTASFAASVLSSPSYVLCMGAGYYDAGVFHRPIGYVCEQPLVITVPISFN
ncbi:MAG: hypothetical protein QOG34_2588 [Frankiaceae bacterium]|jgi:hypothetical protein|nr:hypothetical protein [Frankiaceae bacterium]